MENFEDLKENVLQNIEDLLRMASGSKRTNTSYEIIRHTGYWGTRDQEPIYSLKEAEEIIKESAIGLRCDCEVRGDVNQFSLN